MLTFYDQTTFSDKKKGTHGDCARACIATLLQIRPDSFPHPIASDGNWNGAFMKHLRKMQWSYRTVDFTTAEIIYDTSWMDYVLPQIVMAVGISPRGVRHAVIYNRDTMQIVHDPHPSRAGLETFEAFDYLAPMGKRRHK